MLFYKIINSVLVQRKPIVPQHISGSKDSRIKQRQSRDNTTTFWNKTSYPLKQKNSSCGQRLMAAVIQKKVEDMFISVRLAEL